MADITKAFRVDDGLSLSDDLYIIQSNVNPSIAGFAAPIGSLIVTTTGSVYQKTNTSNTDWTPFGRGNGSVTSVNITPPAAGIGVSGGPITSSGSLILSLTNDLNALENLSGAGFPTRTATDTWTLRNVVGTANTISVTNSDGVAGNVTITLANNPIIPGTQSATLPIGTTAQRPISPTDGMLRYNSDEDILEGYSIPQPSLSTPTVLQRSMIHRKRRWLADDFMTSATISAGANNRFGDLGWYLTAVGTATVGTVNAVTDHPGIMQFGTSAKAGDNTKLHMGFLDTTLIAPIAQIEYFAWLIRIPTITSMVTVLGLGTDTSTTAFGTDGVFFSFDPSVSSSWRFTVKTPSSTMTTTTSTTVAANTWYLLEMYFTGSSWIPVINGVSSSSIAITPSVASANVGALVQASSAASRSVQLDYFSLITRELGARYP